MQNSTLMIRCLFEYYTIFCVLLSLKFLIFFLCLCLPKLTMDRIYLYISLQCLLPRDTVVWNPTLVRNIQFHGQRPFQKCSYPSHFLPHAAYSRKKINFLASMRNRGYVGICRASRAIAYSVTKRRNVSDKVRARDGASDHL